MAQATADGLKLTLNFIRNTKSKLVYGQDESEEPQAIKAVYIEAAALPEDPPEQLQVMIKFK